MLSYGVDSTDRLVLVDGHHLFHRTYNALPRSIVGTDGAPIQGVYGFAGAFLRLVRRFSPTHVCVPFDPPEPPFRRALYPDYRTGWPRGTPEEVANFDRQVAQAGQILDHLGIRHPLAPGFEADDVMGTLATAATTAGLSVTIITGDRDLLQMVGPCVDVFMPKGQEGGLYTSAVVQERWGGAARPISIVAWSPSSPPWTSRPTWRGIAGPAPSHGRPTHCSLWLACAAKVAGAEVRMRGQPDQSVRVDPRPAQSCNTLINPSVAPLAPTPPTRQRTRLGRNECQLRWPHLFHASVPRPSTSP